MPRKRSVVSWKSSLIDKNDGEELTDKQEIAFWIAKTLVIEGQIKHDEVVSYIESNYLMSRYYISKTAKGGVSIDDDILEYFKEPFESDRDYIKWKKKRHGSGKWVIMPHGHSK